MVTEAKKFRIVFMGTPAFAATILEQILVWPKGEVVGVYTQPDRPAKRGQKVLPSEVKLVAEKYSIPCFQPEKLKVQGVVEEFTALRADFLLVAAYGLLIPKTILDLPTYSPLNVHASLLPKYRGAAPVQRAILEQEKYTGVSIMQVVEGLDCGGVYLQERVEVADKTSDELLNELSEKGGILLLKVLEGIVQKKIKPVPQDESLATYAKKLDKTDGQISFHCKAAALHAKIRAVTSWPQAKLNVFLNNQKDPINLILLPGTIEEACTVAAGTIEHDKQGLRIATEDYWYRLTTIKPQGKAFMPVKAYLNGRYLPQGICGHVVETYGV
ncbi:MAG: methionyl-tRNA formyltransferase [Desulfovibrio sp.]|nr:methionyl-tRNA formyltransferase [Desulfovibrio sp.]